jgi:UDP-glucose 4-epimerase
MTSAKKNVVVTGASGLIGSHLVRRLSSEYKVHALSRTPVDCLNENVVWHKLDFNEGTEVSELPSKVEAVVCLAQSDEFKDFPSKALNIFMVNTYSLLMFLDYAHRSGAEAFVYASTGGVYGGEAESFSEDANLSIDDGRNFYASTKICSEIIAANYAELMNISVLRYFFVYGKGQKENMLIPRLIDSVKKSNSIDLYGSKGIFINPVHVSDASAATQKAIGLKGFNKINVAGPEVFSLKEIGEIIGEKTGVEPLFNFEEPTKSSHLVGDIRRMKELLHEPTALFSDKVAEML